MRRHAYNNPGHAHFLTFSCYRMQQLLTDNLLRGWLAEALDNARETEHFDLWAYVFMPDHVHLLIHPQHEDYSVPAILRRIKEPFTRRVVAAWRESSPSKLVLLQAQFGQRTVHRFWQAGGGFDRNMTDMAAVNSAIGYIEYNPVRRGYVQEPVDWAWSSARARAGWEDVPLRVDPVEVIFSRMGEGSLKP
ncbi:MAG: transposase [candidate division Zixibacteria bacterium]|nr:transposase [candidate division Zixibacteria bacterium]